MNQAMPEPKVELSRVRVRLICAVISSAQGGTAIAEWATRRTPEMRRRLRCRRTADGRYEPPS